jgi:hypothetical protein
MERTSVKKYIYIRRVGRSVRRGLEAPGMESDGHAMGRRDTGDRGDMGLRTDDPVGRPNSVCRIDRRKPNFRIRKSEKGGLSDFFEVGLWIRSLRGAHTNSGLPQRPPIQNKKEILP